MEPTLEKQVETARLVLLMLERISADSIWAHRASGLRGSILRLLEQADSQPQGEENFNLLDRLEQLNARGFEIVELAARELRGTDTP